MIEPWDMHLRGGPYDGRVIQSADTDPVYIHRVRMADDAYDRDDTDPSGNYIYNWVGPWLEGDL